MAASVSVEGWDAEGWDVDEQLDVELRRLVLELRVRVTLFLLLL